MSSDSDECKNDGDSTRKRKKTGRIVDVMKKIRLQSHEEGPPCNCKRLKCFENVTSTDRKELLKYFNSLGTNDEQNAYLVGLMTLIPVQRRRPRQAEEHAKFHNAYFGYKVRVKRNGVAKEISVCFKAFQSIYGVSKGKIEYLQKNLKATGTSGNDMRGKHSSKHRKLCPETRDAIYNHINSFKTRLSHYSLHESKKKYLPETLNITKMFNLFKEKYPTIKVSYVTYRQIFNTKFNLSFGYPRSDTCSACDEFQAKSKSLNSERDAAEIRRLTIQNDLHKRKAQTFYDFKKAARKKSKKSSDYLAIALDYQKNISLPNVTTNDVYYLRQFSMYSFNIHVLSTGQSIFYSYPETFAKKGPNEVLSFLFHYITNFMDNNVKHLHIFCDSAGGQNKNYSMFRFIHYVVHKTKLLESIRITFPERGHSYMECDKNMGLVDLKTHMEVPNDWFELLKMSRIRPSPFQVVEVEQDIVKKWDVFLNDKYAKKCPFPIQKVKQIESTREHPRLISFLTSFYGAWTQNPITPVNSKKTSVVRNVLPEGEFELPLPAYTGKL